MFALEQRRRVRRKLILPVSGSGYLASQGLSRLALCCGIERFDPTERGVLMSTSSIRVLVVDDYQPWLNFATKTLRGKLELPVVGEASDGLEAVQKAQGLQPDLILLDIGLPTINGIQAARRILQHSPKTKILFVSEQRSPDIVEEALRTRPVLIFAGHRRLLLS